MLGVVDLKLDTCSLMCSQQGHDIIPNKLFQGLIKHCTYVVDIIYT